MHFGEEATHLGVVLEGTVAADGGKGQRLGELPEGNNELALEHYQAGFEPLLYGILIVLVLIVFLKETGPAAKKV